MVAKILLKFCFAIFIDLRNAWRKTIARHDFLAQLEEGLHLIYKVKQENNGFVSFQSYVFGISVYGDFECACFGNHLCSLFNALEGEKLKNLQWVL